MKLVCPSCGMTASAEAWLNDADARVVMVAVVKLPHPLPQAVLPYMGLFRPDSQALRWQRAGKIVAELARMIASGNIQVQGKVARPCPPRIWAAAMEQMVERRDSIRRPLPNHNYLKQVAWQMADEADAAAESHIRQREASGGIGRGRNLAPANPSTSSTTSQTTPNPLLNQGGGLEADVSPIDAYVQGLRSDKPTESELKEWAKTRRA